MKKLIIAAVIVCVAVISQAATGSWGSSYVFTSDQTDMATYSGRDFAWAVVETLTADNSGITFANGTLVGATAFAGGTATDVQSVDVLGGQGMSGTLTDATAGKYYSLLIWNEQDAKWGISDAVLATINPTDPSGSSLLNNIDFTNGTDPMGVGMPSMVATEAVPEPTSGLLLLLGVAGLALRRRRA